MAAAVSKVGSICQTFQSFPNMSFNMQRVSICCWQFVLLKYCIAIIFFSIFFQGMPRWVEEVTRNLAYVNSAHRATAKYLQLATVRPDGTPANRTVGLRRATDCHSSLPLQDLHQVS